MAIYDHTLYVTNVGDRYVILIDIDGGHLIERIKWKLDYEPKCILASQSELYVGTHKTVERYRIQDGKVYNLGNLKIE